LLTTIIIIIIIATTGMGILVSVLKRKQHEIIKTHESAFFNLWLSLEVSTQPQFQNQETSTWCPAAASQSRCGGPGTEKTKPLINNNNNNNNNTVPKQIHAWLHVPEDKA
jgi:hypothetical protein